MNGAVVAPEFGDGHADGLAYAILQAAYPDRQVVQIAIDNVAAGGGGIHCATQSHPPGRAARPLMTAAPAPARRPRAGPRMPAPERPGKVRSMASRSTQILEAAARVIARRGVRGLRVEELAAEAGVSTALIYYHFKDRTGVLRQTLEFINDRAERYTTDRDPDAPPLSPREELEETLLLELQDTVEVRENSSAWGELRASAVFDEVLREDLARATLVWVQEVAALLGQVHPMAPASSLAAAAERLTALLEGLSMRWLSGGIRIGHARELMSGAIDAELAGLRQG